MAALCPGVQYGLSSQENFGENKDLVFVKLTDSAYRAIEEYIKLKKQNKHSLRIPTIKFLGNEGQFSFPSASPPATPTAAPGGTPPPSTASTTFNFSLSSSADMEGLGGSFECVQQRTQQLSPSMAGGTTLAGLGPITHKMRVHATDDVYEETRKRMTVAEKIHKNKCTQEIKPNQGDIGRKVKVKQQQSSQSAVNLSSSRSGITGSGSGGSNSTRISNHNGIRRNDSTQPSNASSMSSFPSTTAAISSSSMPNSVANSSHSPLKSGSPYSPSLNSGFYNSGSNNGVMDRISGGGNMSTNGVQQRLNGQQSLRSNHVSSSKPPKQSLSIIAKRPLRERLIHLLALRPYKKIELHERLNKEGLRERNLITIVLNQVSTLKDNCFYLNRVMWNDVQEDWPFYTEQEKQILKRRKPQNLTPPGGSDGGSSTGSGNSPTSTHPGSPPSTTNTSLSSGRHRVAHLSNNVQQQQQHQMHGGYNNQQQQQLPPYKPQQHQTPSLDHGKRQNHNLPPLDRRDTSGMNPRSRQPHQQQVQSVGYGVKRQLSDDEDDDLMGGDEGSSATKRQCDSHILSFGVTRDTKPWPTSHTDSTTTLLPQRDNASPSKPSYHKQSLSNASSQQPKPPQDEPDNYNHTTWWTNHQAQAQAAKQQRKEPSVTRVSPDSQSDRINNMQQRGPQVEHRAPDEGVKVVEEEEEDDYVREYTTIRELEQRRQYKSDFNAVYDEYKKLHGVVEVVTQRFQVLDERLKRESAGNTDRCNEIKEQIMREYMKTKKDQRHQRAKRRFEYLHRKLSHIKALVNKFDRQIQEPPTDDAAATSLTY